MPAGVSANSSLFSRTNERERQALTIEKERQVKLQRSHENDLHALQMDLNEVKNQLRDKAAMEKRIEQMKSEVASTSARLKVSDSQIQMHYHR